MPFCDRTRDLDREGMVEIVESRPWFDLNLMDGATTNFSESSRCFCWWFFRKGHVVLECHFCGGGGCEVVHRDEGWWGGPAFIKVAILKSLFVCKFGFFDGEAFKF